MTYIDPDSGVEVNLPDENTEAADGAFDDGEVDTDDGVTSDSPDEPNIDESTKITLDE